MSGRGLATADGAQDRRRRQQTSGGLAVSVSRRASRLGWIQASGLLLLAACLIPRPAVAEQYTVTDVGTLGGRSSVAMAVSATGQVVGWSNPTGSPMPHAFLNDGGGIRDLGTLGGHYSVAFDVNDNGRVVGVSTTNGDAEYHAFLFDGATMRDLGTLGGTYSRAYAINANGQIVGVATTAGDKEFHAFLSDGTTMQDLGTLGGGFSVASAINATGQVVGDATVQGLEPRHAYLFDGATMRDLGTLGGRESRAYSINAGGQIVGESSVKGSGSPRAFLADAAGMRDLGGLGGSSSRAYHINDLGQVVGGATTAGDAAEVGFLYAGGTIRNLNDLIPDGSGWTLGPAQGINNGAQIVGSGQFAGQARAYLLTPVPPTGPTAPGGLVLSIRAPGQISLSWTDISADETGFEIDRRAGSGAFALVAVVSAGQSSYDDAGLSPSTRYTYRVRATGDGGNSDWSDTASTVTPDLPPVAPAGLSASAVSGTRVDLAWIDRSSNETGFAVYRRSGAGDWTKVADLPANATSYADLGLVPLTPYFYQVQAVGTGGISEPSNAAGVTTPDLPPAAPAGLAATVISASRIDLTWMDLSGNETAYAIWRKEGSIAWRRIAVVPPNITSFSDQGVAPSTSYTYRVRATNNVAASAWTNEVGVATPIAAPAAPTGLAARVVSPFQIDLAWSDNSGNETAFAIWRRERGVDWRRIAVVPPNVTSFSDRPISPGSDFQYRVRAINQGGASAWTEEIIGSTPLPAPAAPANLKLRFGSSDSVTFSWSSDRVQIAFFEIWRKGEQGGYARIAILPVELTVFSDVNLRPGSRFTYRVRAIGPNGTSEWSNEITWAVPDH